MEYISIKIMNCDELRIFQVNVLFQVVYTALTFARKNMNSVSTVSNIKSSINLR